MRLHSRWCVGARFSTGTRPVLSPLVSDQTAGHKIPPILPPSTLIAAPLVAADKGLTK